VDRIIVNKLSGFAGPWGLVVVLPLQMCRPTQTPVWRHRPVPGPPGSAHDLRPSFRLGVWSTHLHFL